MKDEKPEITIRLNQELINALPEAMASAIPIAKMYKALFDAMVQQGFTEIQALELLKARGLEV